MNGRVHLAFLLAGLALVLLGCALWLKNGLLVAWNSLVAFCM
ncbi:hypothetical protein [Pedomonas mirosovicensis]|nr:hypothetical protein [Pedomonas mirosovicensis]